jgi:hypothetical protein
MTERRSTEERGSGAVTLREGYVNKGGKNPPPTQVHPRPPDPAPMRPSASDSRGMSRSKSSTERSSDSKSE